MPSQVAKAGTVLLAICFLEHDQASACATILPDNVPTEQVFVTAERAVIIWDQAHHIEHFIRQASMLTQSSDIGFLVPTPQTPELAEVSDEIFNMASFVGQPKRIPPTNYRSPWTLVSPVVMSSLLHLDRLNPVALFEGVSDLKATQRKPDILAEHDVAGYHATTIAADDEQTLSSWLAANGYLSTPELKAWLKPYITAKWKITAFKLIKTDDQAPVLTTRAIRLSFQTDRPFYPYSEPSDRQLASAASPNGRALQVAILSDQRMTGALANENSWPGRIEYAGPSAPSPSLKQAWVASDWLRYALLDDAKHNVKLPTELTTFIDESNPRPGTADLYLYPDKNQSTYQGEAVDFNLSPQDRLVFRYSVLDFGALLMLIILPSVPIYCGWKVLNQPPEEEINPRRRRLDTLITHPAQNLESRKPLLRLADRCFGVLAMMLGVFYGVQFFLLLAGEITSAFFGWSDTRGYWVWMFLGLLLAVILVATMSWGVIYCGVNLWRVRSALAPLRPTNPFYVGGFWQGFMCTSSLLAGAIASLAVLGILVSLL